jgi:GAF domain-containing protein
VELRAFAEEQAALHRVATLVARAAPPQEVFAAVTEEAARVLNTDLARMNRYNPDGGHTVVAGWTSTGETAPAAPGSIWSFGGPNVPTLVFQTGCPARIDDYAEATGSDAELLCSWGLRSAVGVPVSVEGRPWGVLLVGSRADPLPAVTEARLAGFTELVATAIANAEARAALAASGRGSWPPATPPAAGSSGICMTAPSSGWSPLACSCEPRRPRRRQGPAS